MKYVLNSFHIRQPGIHDGLSILQFIEQPLEKTSLKKQDLEFWKEPRETDVCTIKAGKKLLEIPHGNILLEFI